MRRVSSIVAAVACLIPLLAGCGTQHISGGSALPPKSKPAGPHLRSVTLQLPFLIRGYDVPFLAGKALGIYRKAGFAITISQGRSSTTAGELVANGSAAFGFPDAGTAAQLISKGAPLKVLAVYLQKNPAAFAYVPAKTSLKHPADLRGKTLISIGAGDSVYKLLPALLSRYHLAMSDLTVDFSNPSAAIPFFARHPNDIYLAIVLSEPLVKKLVPDVAYKLFSDFGVNTYSNGLITSQDMIRQHPGEVRRFVAATTQAWEWALKHPQTAVDMALKMDPQAGRPLLAGGFAQTIPLLHTGNTEGHTVGWMSAIDWRQTIQTLHKYSGLKTVKPLDAYYTDAFIPAS